VTDERYIDNSVAISVDISLQYPVTCYTDNSGW